MLYGDNAIGGVINIVTKTGVGGPPVAIRGEAGVGSFNQRLAQRLGLRPISGRGRRRSTATPIKSDGYRDNNALDQRNGVGNINYTTPDLKAFLTVTGDDQKLGFPGGRLVDPSIGVNSSSPTARAPATPFDYGNQQGASATAGFTKTLMERRRPDRRRRRAGQEDSRAASSARPVCSPFQLFHLRRCEAADLVDHAAPEHQERRCSACPRTS